MTTPTTEPTSQRTTHATARTAWVAMALLALPCIVYAMDLTVLNLAVPALSADLHPTPTELLWIADVYGFVTAGLLVTMGTVGDRIGRRRLLMIGAGCFAAASVLAALATSVAMLVVARGLLGAAGATLAPSTLSLVAALFPDPRRRTAAIGVWISSFSLGAAIGPLVGGVLLEHFWWGSVFLPAVAVMALVLLLGPRLLPEYRAPDAGRVDLVSVGLAAGAVLPVVFGIKQLAQDGIDVTGVAAIVVGLVVGRGFVGRQRRLADPLLDLRLFASQGFTAALVANTVGFFVNFGSALLLAQYLQSVLGLTPLVAGLWSVPPALAFVVGALIAARVARRVPPAVVVTGGLVVAAVGLAALTVAGQDLVLLAGAWVVASLGLSAVFTLAADVMVGSAPPERAGAASAVSETSSELGGALGIAALGAVAAAVYRASGGSAGTLGDAVAGGTAGSARDAFTAGLQLAVGAGAVLAAAAAAVVARAAVRSRS
jgi:DHA2 family multidrug resistance protein-like MFS transporter